MKKQTTSVYAVIRLDYDLFDLTTGESSDSLPAGITLKEIVPTLETAEAEVRRRNELNAERGCNYYWQHTRLVHCSDSDTVPE